MKKKILIATTNPGKLKELSTMLDADVDWLSLSDFTDTEEVQEDGSTFAENSRKKASGYAQQTGLWTIADDSGLCIDALGGLPGVNSARFSGEKDLNRTLIDHKNIEKVLKLLKNVPQEKRAARFVCHLCLAGPEGVLLETEGKLDGFITLKQAGSGGFGYDPVFFLPQAGKTAAQLTAEEKNAVSHRANAVKQLKPLLCKLLNT